MIFRLHGEVTVSAYIEVEAETLEEAIEIGEERSDEPEFKLNGYPTEEKDSWCVTDLDGYVNNIKEVL